MGTPCESALPAITFLGTERQINTCLSLGAEPARHTQTPDQCPAILSIHICRDRERI